MRDNVKSGALTEVTFYILLSLYSPKHGYAVMQFIEEKTGGRLSLGAGTLYGALNSMQEKGWIELFGDSEGRKKEYLITVKGKEIAEKELIRLRELVGIAHDFYFYRAHYAHDLYNEIKVSSRSGINQTPESLEQLDQLVSPFLLKGQPLSHIYASNQQHQHTGPCDQQHSCSFFHSAPPPVHVYDGDILLCKKHTNQMSRHPNSCVL